MKFSSAITALAIIASASNAAAFTSPAGKNLLVYGICFLK